MLKFISSLTLCQTLDGKLGGGENEAHGKYSAKEGIRSNQVRPRTHVQEQGRPGTNIQVIFDSRITKVPLPAYDVLRGWMESLVKCMANTTQRMGSDQSKPD